MNKKTHLIHILIGGFLLSATMLWGQKGDFPYQLKAEDAVIVGAGVSAKLYADYSVKNQRIMTYEELAGLEPKYINGFDRGAAGNWNSQLHEISGWSRAVLVASPAAVLLHEGVQKEWKNCLIYGAMYFEVALITMGLTDLTKSLTMRKRPYLYNSDIGMAQKQQMIDDDNAFDSFFSGHTAIAFASAVFLSTTFTDIYGEGAMSTIIWGTSLAVASSTGFLRFKSGHHFPTDVIAGALVGGVIGYLIPVLHKKNARLNNISFTMTGQSMTLSYVFKK